MSTQENGERASRHHQAVVSGQSVERSTSVGSSGRSRLHKRADAIDGFHQFRRHTMSRRLCSENK
jgi:hypothetical protein